MCIQRLISFLLAGISFVTMFILTGVWYCLLKENHYPVARHTCTAPVGKATVTNFNGIRVYRRIPRITRSACSNVPASRGVRWRCAMRISPACGLTASRIALPAFRSPVERKTLLSISGGADQLTKAYIYKTYILFESLPTSPSQLGGLPVPRLPRLPVCV